MYITPILSSNIYNSKKYHKSKINFKAHPDFYKYNSTVSCFFRRGAMLLSNPNGYSKIEKLFCKIFNCNENTQKRMLIIGIGNSQEPFSYLASIGGILKNKPIEKHLDLYTVDLQSKPEKTKLKINALSDLLEYEKFPEYAGKSFIMDSRRKWLGIKDTINKNFDPLTEFFEQFDKEAKKESKEYRINDNIYNFIEKTYNNPEKSKWDSRIQETITGYPDEKFDIISANNILPYIISEKELLQTVENIVRTLKKDGYFITDPYENMKHLQFPIVKNNLTQVYPGIFQKI